MSDLIMTANDSTRYSFDNIQTQGWLDGHECGLDAAVNWLRDRAVTLFRNGKDEAAIDMRTLADEMSKAIRPRMQELAANHARDFPAMLTDDPPSDP